MSNHVNLVGNLIGRKKIHTDETEVTRQNIASIVNLAMNTDHAVNRSQMEYLFKYERGLQPVIDRTKNIRPEICNVVIENHASEVVDFTVGYQAGNPINLVARSMNAEQKHSDKRILKVNEMLAEENKQAKDIELFRNFHICGVAYAMILPKDEMTGTSPFDLLVLDPRNTFIVYSNDAYERPMVAVTYSVLKNGTKRVTAYTEDYVYDFGLDSANGTTSFAQVPNILRMIPIVEFKANDDYAGCFEKAIPLMDAINDINSNRVDDIEQFVQSILWLHNAELSEEAQTELANGGGILQTKSVGNGQDAKVVYLTQTLNQNETQTYVDYLYKQILQICGVPSREKSTGGNTGSAMYLSNGYEQAESRAKTMESMYSRSMLQVVELILRICRLSINVESDVKELETRYIDIEFSRDRTYDLASRTNALATLINTGIEPLHAMRTVDLFNDVETVYHDSAERIDKALFEGKSEVENLVNVESTNAGIDVTDSTMGEDNGNGNGKDGS
jgi:SPP1 family phage portal protein